MNVSKVSRFFNFKFFYSMFDLEFKKEKKILENKDSIEEINEHYEEALNIKKNATVSGISLSYKDLSIMDLYTLKNGLVPYINVKEIKELYDYMSDIEDKIKTEIDEENIKSINLDFSKKYFDIVGKYVNDYKERLFNNNALDEKQINRINFYSKESDILSKKLGTIIDKLNDIVKPDELVEEVNNTDKKEKIDLINISRSASIPKFNYIQTSEPIINLKQSDSDTGLKSIKEYSNDEIRLIDFSDYPGKYFARALACIHMYIDKMKNYLYREEFKSALEKYYPEIDKFFVNIVYDFSKKLAKEPINSNKDVSEVTKKYLAKFAEIFNKLCNEINAVENINLVANYDDGLLQPIGVLQK